ncbi:MAG: hypothetical protein ACOC2D_13665 [Spirochaetota bacterium]
MRVALVILIVVTAAVPGTLAAQEFGRNKVRYEDFDFSVLESGNFRVHFPQEIEQAARRSARLLERWTTRFERLFDHTLSQRQPVILHDDHPDFQQTQAIPGLLPQGVGGVTEGRRGRIVVPLPASNRETNHVLGHELVHGFHFDLAGGSLGGGGGGGLPLWFVEGMAEYATLGPSDAQTALWLRDAVLNDDLPSIARLGRDPTYNPYRFGHALWAFIADEHGDAVLPRLYRQTLRRSFRRASSEVLGVDPDELSDAWHEEVRRVADEQMSERTAPEDTGEPVDAGEAGTKISPSLDPSGRYLAYYAQPDVFSFDLTVADVETGRVVGRLSAISANRHFDQLRFTESAGAFSPSGERIAFVVQEQGDNAVAIASVPGLQIERTLAFERLDGISHVAWHPSGERLVLAATQNGRSNLYEIDLQADSLSRLTNTWFTDLQPRYSPDGSRLVWLTDRRDASPGSLSYGAITVVVRDVASGDERLVALDGAHTHLDPHFSADGGSLYLVADPDGVPNVYAVDLSDGEARRLTNAATGVTGFTDLAPALTVAGGSDRAVFSVFSRRDYSLRTMELADAKGTPVAFAGQDGAGAHRTGSHLVSGRSDDSLVARYLRDPASGLPDGSGFSASEYDPALALSDVSRIIAGVSASRFGVFFYGSAHLTFTDLLAIHTVGLTAVVRGSARDLGGELGYFNRDRRLGWGVVAGRAPLRSESVSSGEGTVELSDGSVVTADIAQRVIDRTYIDQANLVGEYPLSRWLRFEGFAGYRRISFSREVQTIATRDGEVILRRSDMTTPEPPLHLGQGGLAFVGDTSSFGFTGPLDGRRFRLDVDGAAGSLAIVNAGADFRQYAFLAPFGFASRIWFRGQLVKADPRGLIGPLGLSSAVRGYAASERTRGTRTLGASAEIRLPFLGTEQLGLIPFRWLPTTVFAFADAGVAWYSDRPPQWLWESGPDVRAPVASAGGGLRVSVLGAIVLGLTYAWPFHAQESGGVLTLSLGAGF